MRGMNTTSRWRRAAGLAVGAGALAFTVACSGARDAQTTLSARAADAGAAGQPVLVSCEPDQRTLVRPVVVNGAAVSQVECVPAAAVGGGGMQPAASAWAPAPAPYVAPAPVAPRVAPQPVHADLGDARVVSTSGGTARPVRTNQVIYDERPVKKTRTVKKSAVIIGSSAGVGAGVGAAMGGKKGALIGAAIGGGGAAIWDQVTRR